MVVRGRELRRAQDGAQVGLHAGLRVHDAHRAADPLFQRRRALQVHEQLEPAPLSRPAARGVPLRIGVCRYFPPFEGARAELTVRF